MWLASLENSREFQELPPLACVLAPSVDGVSRDDTSWSCLQLLSFSKYQRPSQLLDILTQEVK